MIARVDLKLEAIGLPTLDTHRHIIHSPCHLRSKFPGANFLCLVVHITESLSRGIPDLTDQIVKCECLNGFRKVTFKGTLRKPDESSPVRPC